MEHSEEHIPVLKDEVETWLQVTQGGVFFDGTVGLGGHSGGILGANEKNTLLGTDKDRSALEKARKHLEPYNGRFTLFHSDFKDLESLEVPVETIDGFLFDLGVSSFQLDDPDKGFSYAREAPLDMRMDITRKLSAREVVNGYSYRQLTDILQKYGEFKQPGKIVDQLVYHRKTKPIETTEELKTIIRRVLPRQRTMDPLARVFQAIRIEVNGELEGLENFFARLGERMKPGARLAIISFHSLEDRIAKTALKQGKEKKLLNILTKKPVIAGDVEMKENPRARSAKLRVAEKRNDGIVE